MLFHERSALADLGNGRLGERVEEVVLGEDGLGGVLRGVVTLEAKGTRSLGKS